MRTEIIFRITALIYAFLLTGLFINSDIRSVFEWYVLYSSLYLPVLLTLKYKRMHCLEITSFCMFGSLLSYGVFGGLLKSNLGPIAFGFVFAVLIPGAITLNVITLIIKKFFKARSGKFGVTH